jgi:hypothetical protein
MIDDDMGLILVVCKSWALNNENLFSDTVVLNKRRKAVWSEMRWLKMTGEMKIQYQSMHPVAEERDQGKKGVMKGTSFE